MYGSASSSCDQASFSLRTDDIGRHWEDFFIAGEYQFSNQIPSINSYTTTTPGKVFYDRGLCSWQAPPTERPGAQYAQASAGGETAVMGLIMVLCIAGAGVYAWFKRGESETDPDYHPMSDVPEMPWVWVKRQFTNEDRATTGDSATTQGDSQESEDGTGDSQNESQANDDGVLDVPWDDVTPTGAAVGATGAADTVPQPSATPAYGIDRLKGTSMKAFKEQLAKNGVDVESGHFKSVELLRFKDAQHIVHYRMLEFWKQYGSKRVPFAVYYVFGLQNGGSRSPQFMQNYDLATEWIKNWYSEVLGNV